MLPQVFRDALLRKMCRFGYAAMLSVEYAAVRKFVCQPCWQHGVLA